MTTKEFYELPQANRDAAYFGNIADGVNRDPYGFRDWLMRLSEAAYKQVLKTAKYYGELDQLYCPVCGARVKKYQQYCGSCGQKLRGTFDLDKPEEVFQEPVIDNDTGEVDWGDEEE